MEENAVPGTSQELPLTVAILSENDQDLPLPLLTSIIHKNAGGSHSYSPVIAVTEISSQYALFHFADEMLFLDFIVYSTINSDGEVYRIIPLDVSLKYIKIEKLPAVVPENKLRRSLYRFGSVLRVEQDYFHIPECPTAEILMSTRRILMRASKPIPERMTIAGFPVNCTDVNSRKKDSQSVLWHSSLASNNVTSIENDLVKILTVALHSENIQRAEKECDGIMYDYTKENNPSSDLPKNLKPASRIDDSGMDVSLSFCNVASNSRTMSTATNLNANVSRRSFPEFPGRNSRPELENSALATGGLRDSSQYNSLGIPSSSSQGSSYVNMEIPEYSKSKPRKYELILEATDLIKRIDDRSSNYI